LEVVLVARAFVGVAGDLDHQEFGVVLERRGHGVEQAERLRADLGARRLEHDLLEDQDVVALDHDLPAIGAPVLVLEAVVGLGLVRAAILHVEDAVLVVVGLGAAILVLEAVLVLGVVRAAIVDVADAVLVVVGLGAAVFVLEAVLVLGDVGALVARIEDAVTVAIAVGAFGAPVFVL